MKIGIICAMDEETEYFLSKFDKYEKKEFGSTIFYEATTNEGKEVVLARSGIGKCTAAAVTAMMICMYQVSYVINSGIAGSIAKGLHIGDLVFSTKAAYHDADFTAFGYKKGQMAGQELYFNANPELIAKAEIAAMTIPEIKDKVKKGLVVSGDQFINSPEKKQAIIVLFIVNTILAIALLIYLYWPRYIEIDGVRERWYMDGLTGMMILSTSAVAALFSAIPISLCCYWFKRNRE